MRYERVRANDNKGREIAMHTDAIHTVDNGAHCVQAANGTVSYYPLSSVITCVGLIKEEPTVTNQIAEGDFDTDVLIDAGNELYRLVVETRDSIFDSNAIPSTDTFPDTPEGKDGKKWYKEYRNAARAWYNTLYKS